MREHTLHLHTGVNVCRQTYSKTCMFTPSLLRWVQAHSDTVSAYTHVYTTQWHTRVHCSNGTAQSWVSSPRHLSVGLGVVPILGVV